LVLDEKLTLSAYLLTKITGISVIKSWDGRIVLWEPHGLVRLIFGNNNWWLQLGKFDTKSQIVMISAKKYHNL